MQSSDEFSLPVEQSQALVPAWVKLAQMGQSQHSSYSVFKKSKIANLSLGLKQVQKEAMVQAHHKWPSARIVDLYWQRSTSEINALGDMTYSIWVLVYVK